MWTCSTQENMRKNKICCNKKHMLISEKFNKYLPNKCSPFSTMGGGTQRKRSFSLFLVGCAMKIPLETSILIIEKYSSVSKTAVKLCMHSQLLELLMTAINGNYKTRTTCFPQKIPEKNFQYEFTRNCINLLTSL